MESFSIEYGISIKEMALKMTDDVAITRLDYLVYNKEDKQLPEEARRLNKLSDVKV